MTMLVSRNDFKTMGLLGEGSYGIVSLVEKDGQAYALKEISKSFALKVIALFLYSSL